MLAFFQMHNKDTTYMEVFAAASLALACCAQKQDGVATEEEATCNER